MVVSQMFWSLSTIGSCPRPLPQRRFGGAEVETFGDALIGVLFSHANIAGTGEGRPSFEFAKQSRTPLVTAFQKLPELLKTVRQLERRVPSSDEAAKP